MAVIQQQLQTKQEKSLGELFGDLTQDIMRLVRQELALARTEMSQNLSRVTAQIGLLAAGGALAYAGVLTVVAGIVLLLARAGLSPWLAAFLVGIVVAGAGAFMVTKAIRAIKQQDLKPRLTLETLNELKDEVK